MAWAGVGRWEVIKEEVLPGLICRGQGRGLGAGRGRDRNNNQGRCLLPVVLGKGGESSVAMGCRSEEMRDGTQHEGERVFASLRPGHGGRSRWVVLGSAGEEGSRLYCARGGDAAVRGSVAVVEGDWEEGIGLGFGFG